MAKYIRKPKALLNETKIYQGKAGLPKVAFCLKCGKPFAAEYVSIGGRWSLKFHLCEACRQSNYYFSRIDVTGGEHSIAYGS